MIPKEILKKIRQIELRTLRLVNETLAGQYHSVFKGQGMNFEEVREYQPGDEVRAIDWNVTARMGHPYIKKFMAEREMTVLLMVDGSASLRFGTALEWKSELAAEVAAVLGFSAIRNNDKVGLCLFSDRIESFVRPQKGRTHTLRLIRDILEFSPEPRATRLDEALAYVNRVLKRKAVVFLLSDFYQWDERLLAVTGRRHDLIALQIKDPREETLPNAGLVEMVDAETGARILIDTASADVRRRFQVEDLARQRELDSVFRRLGIDHLVLKTDHSFVQPLMGLFERRVKRFR